MKIFTLRESITDKINKVKTLTICKTHKCFVSTANKELFKIKKKHRLSSYHGCKTNHLQIQRLQITHLFCSWICSSGRAEWRQLLSAPLTFSCNTLTSGYRSHVKGGKHSLIAQILFFYIPRTKNDLNIYYLALEENVCWLISYSPLIHLCRSRGQQLNS